MNETQSGGVGILGVVLIVFVILKLVGVITWSWWLVLIPLWIILGFWAIGLLIALILALVN